MNSRDVICARLINRVRVAPLLQPLAHRAHTARHAMAEDIGGRLGDYPLGIRRIRRGADGWVGRRGSEGGGGDLGLERVLLLDGAKLGLRRLLLW